MFSAAWLKFSLLKKTIKISPSMIENISADGCLSLGCIVLIYSWGEFKQRPLEP